MKRAWLQAVLVFITLTAIYLVPAPREDVLDTLPARYLPLSLLREADLDLDEFPFLFDGAAAARWSSVHGTPYFLRRQGGHVVSSFSPGVAVLALPVYALPAWAGLPADSPRVSSLEHLAASALSALAAVFLMQALREVVPPRPAIFLTLLFAWGTTSFSITSRALWEHTGGQLCLSAALFALVSRGGGSLLLSGLALGAAVSMRPTNLVVVLPIALYVWRTTETPRERAAFAMSVAAPLLLLLAYNAFVFGAPWRSGRDNLWRARFWATTPWEGFLGLLVSPGRGLLVYSPVFLLLPLALRAAWRGRDQLLLALWMGVGLLLLLCATRTIWWGGWTFGPRLLADAAPLLVFLLHPIFREARPYNPVSLIAGVLASCSVAFHAAGAFYYRGHQEARPNVDLHPARLWQWSASPLTLSLAAARDDLRNSRREAAIVRRQLPTSRESIAGLAARYELAGPLIPALPDSSAVLAPVCATNTGSVVWSARAADYRGAVRLGWRWRQAGRPLTEPWGREDLPYPIFPGERHCFRAWIEPPGPPGAYVLQLELVSEHLAWFSDRGVASLLVPYQRLR